MCVITILNYAPEEYHVKMQTGLTLLWTSPVPCYFEYGDVTSGMRVSNVIFTRNSLHTEVRLVLKLYILLTTLPFARSSSSV
jgi:hypothetical protein